MLLFYTHFTKNSITRITDPLTERLLHCYKYEPREGRMSLLHSYIKKRRNPHWRNVVNNRMCKNVPITIIQWTKNKDNSWWVDY